MTFKFNVSEARTAIACPRIFYFDERRHRATGGTKRLTQIWSGAKNAGTACGALFHNTVEKFNKLAPQAPLIRAAVERASVNDDGRARTERLRDDFMKFANETCLNRERLNRKQAAQIQAFVGTLKRYMEELADVVGFAVAHGRAVPQVLEEFFSDHSKRVDVTYNVGPQGQRVNIRGAIDYIYFDYRVDAVRIIDFKLTSSVALAKDLLQAALYALMHHQQHNTRCSAAVLYLFPDRRMAELSWEEIDSNRHQLFDLLASMAAWAEYDEQTRTGTKPPAEPALCGSCPWNKGGQCEQRLGPKSEGHRLTHWSEAALQNASVEPVIERRQPAEAADPVDYDESDDDVNEVPDEPAALPKMEVAQPKPAENQSGLYLGKTERDHRPVMVPLSNLKTHVAVMGAAGSGKSWLAKVIAEEAIRQGVPVLAIDPQGDLVQFLHPATLPVEAVAEDRAKLAEFRQRAEVRIWTPGTSHGIRLALSPLRLPTESELQGIESPQRRREESDAMLGVAAANLVTLAQTGGDLDVQKTFVLELLRKLVAGRQRGCTPSLNDIIAAIEAPENLGLDDADRMISKREREKLKQRLYARLRGATANLFSGGTPLDLDHFVAPHEAGKVPLNVIYLNAMADDSQKQYFVAALAAEVYRWMITTPSSDRVRLLLYLDEARDFLPAGASKPPAKEPLLRLFAQGRKFGVGCLICTQSPRSVDYQAFSNASTKLIGRLEATQDVARVGEWFTDGGGTPKWLAGRNGADRGTFVGRWPDAAADVDGQTFQSRRLYSLHEAAWSPSRVETEWAKTSLSRDLTLNAQAPDDVVQ